MSANRIYDYEVDFDEEGVPVDALPYAGNCMRRLNPYDKKRRRKQLNFQEKDSFSAICKLGSNQLIDCYARYDEMFNLLDFSLMCKECKYYHGLRREIDYAEQQIAYTVFDARFIKNRFKEYISEDYDEAKGYVYYISDGKYIKVGQANNTGKRLSALQTSNAYHLYVLYEIPVKTKLGLNNLECGLHNYYRDYRVRGEWFDIMGRLEHSSFRLEFPSMYTGKPISVMPDGTVEK